MKKVLILSALLILCIGCTRIDNTDDYKVIIDDIIWGKQYKYKYSPQWDINIIYPLE